MSTAARLTSGRVGPVLTRMTLPLVVGMMANMAFNLVDTYYISRLGTQPLAAMGFTFPLVFFITGTAMGMGIGVASVVSRAIGQGNQEKVQRLATDSLFLAVCLVLALSAIGLLGMDAVFRIMGASEALLPMIRQYMVPWFFGVVLLVVPMVGNSAIRATGNTLAPSLLMLTAGCVNVILDPLLIFGIGPFPRLELRGAALATVLSYAVVCCGSIGLLRFRFHMLSFHRVPFREILRSWREVLHIALPAIGTNQMVPIANGLLTAWVARHGDAAVAAWGVGTRLESLMMGPSFALSTAMAPFAGQNFGAGRTDRVMSALRFAARYCFGIGACVWMACAFAGGLIASRFSQEPQTLALIQRFLWIVPCSHGAFGLMLQITSTFNAHRRPKESVMVFISRFFLFILPLAWLGNRFHGLTGMFGGVAAGNVLACLLALLLLRRMFRVEAPISGGV